MPIDTVLLAVINFSLNIVHTASFFFLWIFSAGKNFDGPSHSCLVFCINIIMHFGEKQNFTWLYELTE